MPTRMVDGDALWRSDKLAQVMPANFRAEYANLIPLALADGTFECNPRRVWADVYSYNRPDVPVTMVEDILNEFERVGLLKRSARKGKTWGFWVGIESRLPVANQSQLLVAEQSQRGRNAVAEQSQGVLRPVAGGDVNSIESNSSPVAKFGHEIASYDVKNLRGYEGKVGGNWSEVFGQAKRVYRRFVGKSFGSLGPRSGQWQELIESHGGVIVLAAVEMWAQEGGKGLRDIRWPVAMFLKNAEEFIEAVKSTTAETAQQENELNSAARAAEEGRRLAIEERDKDLQRIAEEEQQAENFTI